MPAAPKTNRIEFRLPPEAKRDIERAAMVQGRTLTDFAIDTLTERARAVLAEHDQVRLSNRDRDIFLAMLDADPKPNSALLKAARRQRDRVR
jgi:uncharacterized protein (DUF1778 family)